MPKNLHSCVDRNDLWINQSSYGTERRIKKAKQRTTGRVIYDFLIKVNTLTAQGRILKAEVNKLKTPKNSGNSSFPPSQYIYRKKSQSLCEKSIRNPGRQPGHKGATLLISPVPNKVIEQKPGGI